MKIAGTFEREGVKNICGIVMMRRIMCQLLGVGSLGGFRIYSMSLGARRGSDKVDEVWAMGCIFKGDYEVGAEAGGALLGGAVDDVRGGRLKRVPVVDVSGGLGSGIGLLKINIVDRSIIGKSTCNAIKAVSNRVMKQILAIQAIAINEMEAKWVGGGCVAGALKYGEDGAQCMPSQSIPECLIVKVMENMSGDGSGVEGQTHGRSAGA